MTQTLKATIEVAGKLHKGVLQKASSPDLLSLFLGFSLVELTQGISLLLFLLFPKVLPRPSEPPTKERVCEKKRGLESKPSILQHEAPKPHRRG